MRSFLGHSVARTQNVSEETARKIDSEVKRLVDEGYNEAKRILTERNDDWETLAQGLLEFETLTGEEIQKLLRGEKVTREDIDQTPVDPPSSVPTAGAPSGEAPDGEPQGA